MRQIELTESQSMLKHIPNVLTGCRLVLIVPFLVCLYRHQYVDAFYLYFLAGFTDAMDGWLARYYRWQTPLGSFIDPLADKLLIASSFISLALIGRLPWWLVVLVFMRDLTISLGVVGWYWLVQRKLDFKPTFLSKINTTLQLGLVTLCLFELAYYQPTPFYITQALIIATAITTGITYLHYVWVWGKKAYCINQSCQ